MAINVAPSWFKDQYSLLEQFFYRQLAFRLSKPRQMLRRARMSIEPAPKAPSPHSTCSSRTFSTQEKEQFRDRDWVFVEDFLDKEYFQWLTGSWPPSYHFRPMHQIDKSYDNDLIDSEFTFSRNPALQEFRKYFDSPEFSDTIMNLCGDNIRRRFGRIIPGRAYAGSRLTPHLDAAANDIGQTGINENVNIIFFVQATGGPNSGGTCVLSGNDWKDLVFEPVNLTNSALIYKMNTIYHGFRKMRRGTFRKTLIFNMLQPTD